MMTTTNTAPLRVLHLLKTSVGAQWAYRQTRELVKLGVEVHVALPDGGALIPRYREAGVHVHLHQFDYPLRAPWRLHALRQQLTGLLAQVQPDILHSHFVGTTLTMRHVLGNSSSLPRIFQVPGPLHLEHALYRNVELASAGNHDYWVGSCQWTRDEYIRRGIAADRVFLAYYGTDIDTYCTRPGGKLRAELGVPSDAKIVGMVAFQYAPKWFLGQRRGLKGHEDLIDALALCLRERDDIYGVFVGGAWNNAHAYTRQLEAYAKARCGDRVIWLGTRADVAELYPDFDLAVHPSHSENVGGASESCLMGIPTLTTTVGGFPDLIQDGKTGWLAPPRDPVALSRQILAALADPEQARQFAANGQARAREILDVRRNARDLFTIYQTIHHHAAR